MGRKWVVAKERIIEVDPRHLKMQSAQAIRSVVDGLVELITNSDDAYRVLGDTKGKVIIEISRHRGKTHSQLVVKDRAGGMTNDEMKEKILKYGGFLAHEESRGYMGRGAKDVVALGDVTFESIKKDKLFCVEINSDFKTIEMRPFEAKKEDYKEFGLKPGKGGMCVKIKLSKKHKLPQFDTLIRQLQRNYSLRDILQRREVYIRESLSGNKQLLRYASPEGEKVIEERLDLQGPYQGASADIEIFKAPSPLPIDLQEGIIICDEHAVHQVTRFSSDLDQDALGCRLFGRLQCNYIRKLQLEFEDYRRQGKEPPVHNPVDIVDPNRRRGLDKENHPFVSELFDWAEELLRIALDLARDEESEKSREVASEDTRKLLSKLSKAAAEHLRERLEEENLAPRTPEQKAELHKEGVLLNPPFERIAVGEKRRMAYTVLSFGEEMDPTNVTVEIDNEALFAKPKKPRLKPQRKDPDRLTAYFEIEGLQATKNVTLTVRHQHEDLIAPVSRTLEIVESVDPYATLPHGLFFENQTYSVHDNGMRTLAFLAKGRKFRTVDWYQRKHIETSNAEAVTIMRGGVPIVNEVAKDVWRGEIKVRGKGVGKRSTISVSVPAKQVTEATSALVQVVHKEEAPAVSIEIELSPEPCGHSRAVWDREMPNRLKVFTSHPTLKRYLGSEEDKWPGQKNPHFRLLLAEIVADKVVQRILEDKFDSNPRLFEDPSSLFFHHTEELTWFLPIAHRIMISDQEARKLVTANLAALGSRHR